MDRAHVALAFEGASWTSEYAFPLMLMQTMLGSYDRASGMGKNVASRMCQEIAMNECAHSISTFNTCYKDTGLFGIYAVAPDNKLDDMKTEAEIGPRQWHLNNSEDASSHPSSGHVVRQGKQKHKVQSGVCKMPPSSICFH